MIWVFWGENRDKEKLGAKESQNEMYEMLIIYIFGVILCAFDFDVTKKDYKFTPISIPSRSHKHLLSNLSRTFKN